MSLRRPQQLSARYPLSEALESVAETAGKLASHLEPEIAAYQIGLTYTYILTAAYRSTNGIYYTPPILTQHLIHLATKTGVDWSSCRVLDPAFGGGAFLAPIGSFAQIAFGIHLMKPAW